MKPTRLKVLEGNPGKRTLKEEPEPEPILPPPPAFLDDYAQKEWVIISDSLYALGLLTEIDINTLAAYCGAYSRWRHAEEGLNILKQKGDLNALVIKTTTGNWIQQPLIGIANKAAADMVRYASEFGMTPVARAKLGTAPSKEDDKFEKLIGLVKK
jgi:P27 family predicted phage terminase small subunit